MPQRVYVSPVEHVSDQIKTLQGLRCHTILDLLGEAEVDQFEMPVRIYEDILRLQVSVCHSLLFVQELQDQHNLGSIELTCWLIEASRSPQV